MDMEHQCKVLLREFDLQSDSSVHTLKPSRLPETKLWEWVGAHVKL